MPEGRKSVSGAVWCAGFPENEWLIAIWSSGVERTYEYECLQAHLFRTGRCGLTKVGGGDLLPSTWVLFIAFGMCKENGPREALAVECTLERYSTAAVILEKSYLLSIRSEKLANYPGLVNIRELCSPLAAWVVFKVAK